jgi:hypothetical protein
MTKTYVPLSRGLMEHLPSLSDNALKVYLYILMSAKHTGKDKGKADLSMRELAGFLKKDVHSVFNAICELRGKYVEFHGAKNQTELSYFIVLKYKDVSDFAVVNDAVVVGGAVEPIQRACCNNTTARVVAVEPIQQVVVNLQQREKLFADAKAKLDAFLPPNNNNNLNTDNNNTKNTGSGGGNFKNKLIATWKEIYLAKTGSEYNATSKDYVLLSNLMKKFSEEKIVEKAQILLRLCETSGIWFTKNWMADFTIGKLSCQWNSLLKNAGKKTVSERNARKMEEVAQEVEVFGG